MERESNPVSSGGQPIAYDAISLIETDLEPDNVSLYMGGTDAARDIALLREHNISTVVNCAVNLDINYVLEPHEHRIGDKCAHGVGPIRTYKLGLVDGHGNSNDMMLASYLLLDGAIRQTIPVKSTYPRREKGNVLVHCRGGRSRSAALLALFLNLHKPEKYRTLDCALAHVRKRRGLHPSEWSTAPKPVLVESARLAARQLRILSRLS